ncbi:hypothetical protein BDV93DRAFT_500439 [Ceratobasidium sp. AG-I]|nr:hypothetical protein BDV93DRAFT_500439 [Ceratobasidium sp. AG-I]
MTTKSDLTTPAGLTAYLENTDYAAKDVEILSGGSSGFTYRVLLKVPLTSGERSVVIKHVLEYPSSNKNMELSAERMDFEHEALRMVASSPLVSSTSTVQVPHVHMYDSQTHTLIMRDVAPARLLSTVLIESLEKNDPAHILELSSKIGSALGDFMGRFHQWTSLPEQSSLRARFAENLVSREVVLAYRHQLMLESAVKFGLERDWMEGVVQAGVDDARQGGPVIAMGDFWFDNVLVSEDEEQGLRIYIVDWEVARCTHPELDITQFATAAYTMTYVYPTKSFQFMQSFYKSYKAHFEVDILRMGLSGGRDMMSYGIMMPWIRHKDDTVKEGIAREGLRLLEVAKDGDADAIRDCPVIRDMYAV